MGLTLRLTVFDGTVVEESRAGVLRDYVPDAIGSTIALLGASQTITDTYSFWPYGDVVTHEGASASSFLFVGSRGYYSHGGAIYVRARWFSVNTGRWNAVDPLLDSSFRYAYCENSPQTKVDPTGLHNMGYECKCEDSNKQKEIAQMFTNFCNSPTRDAIDACITEYCADRKTDICLVDFCSSADTWKKFTVHCEDSNAKGDFAVFDHARRKLTLFDKFWKSAGPAGGKECILLHELIHACGHEHKTDKWRSHPQSEKADCLCSNCTNVYNPNCRTFYHFDEITKTGSLIGFNDCNGLSACPVP